MKTNPFFRFAGILIVFICTTGATASGIYPDGKGRNQANLQPSCINSISGLSEYQRERITSMEVQNQTAVKALQDKRQAATDKNQKEEIKKELEKQALNHRNAITSVLSADQQKQFLQFQSNGGTPGNHPSRQATGKGNGRGKGNGSGKGNGRRYAI